MKFVMDTSQYWFQPQISREEGELLHDLSCSLSNRTPEGVCYGEITSQLCSYWRLLQLWCYSLQYLTMSLLLQFYTPSAKSTQPKLLCWPPRYVRIQTIDFGHPFKNKNKISIITTKCVKQQLQLLRQQLLAIPKEALFLFFDLNLTFHLIIFLLAEAVLRDQDAGSFVVRDSTSYRGCFGLAMKVHPVSSNPASISKPGTGASPPQLFTYSHERKEDESLVPGSSPPWVFTEQQLKELRLYTLAHQNNLLYLFRAHSILWVHD